MRGKYERGNIWIWMQRHPADSSVCLVVWATEEAVWMNKRQEQSIQRNNTPMWMQQHHANCCVCLVVWATEDHRGVSMATVTGVRANVRKNSTIILHNTGINWNAKKAQGVLADLVCFTSGRLPQCAWPCQQNVGDVQDALCYLLGGRGRHREHSGSIPAGPWSLVS